MSKKIDTEKFVALAKEVHGNKYDYSKVNYIKNNSKVCIVCKEHGEFWQRPDKHLLGQGCPKCSKTNKSNTFNFIQKAQKIHGDKYDYSKVIYVNNSTKVCIICKEHGEFWQTPHNHLKGKGCSQCAKQLPHPTKLTTEEFIKRANEIHCNRYDYSKVEYNTMFDKVLIICKEHGEFWQTPSSHLNGNGCPICGKKLVGEKKKSSTERFIEMAKQVHDDKYDYSKVDYNDARSKVGIICKHHGIFFQAPYHHLQGCGCPICASNKKLTTQEFIEKAKQIHGDKYNYSKVDYINTTTKISIICPIHGDFFQAPYHHLQGCGCPICSSSHLEKEINEFLNENNIIFETQKKFIWLGKQSLDFYLPEYNIAIECQGIQHFEPNEHFGGEKAFDKQRHLDEYKKDCCNKHSVNILYYSKCGINFPYKVYEDTKDLLNEIIKTEKNNITIDAHKNKEEIKLNENNKEIPNELINFIYNLVGRENVVVNDNNTINSNITFYFPLLNVGIMYNQLNHGFGNLYSLRDFNFNKTKLCNENNIKLLQIFEDEFYFNKEIVYNKISHILKQQMQLPTIMGRKCIIKEIKSDEAKEFLNKYHIQGYAPSTIYLGGFYNNELVAVMSFKKDVSRDKKVEDVAWDLTRFASNYNYIFQGIGGKLFKYFTRNYDYNEIKSFADRRWTIDEDNNIYKQLGFEFDSYLSPDYRYIDKSEHPLRCHKFGFRIHTLHKKYGVPLTMTEREMTEYLGFIRVYDCGLIKYIYKNKER